MAQIKSLEGALLGVTPLSHVGAFLVEKNLTVDDVEVVPTQEELRADVRDQIEREVGDDKTLIGILSDNVQLLTVFMLATIASNAGSTDPAQEEMNGILQALAGEDDIVALAQNALDQIITGEIVLTAAAKGVANVTADGFGAGSKVAEILSRA